LKVPQTILSVRGGLALVREIGSEGNSDKAEKETVAKYRDDMPLAELSDEVSQRLSKRCHLRKISGYLNRTEVFAVNMNEAVVKVFHHAAESKFAREVSAYRALEGTSLPVASLIATGKLKDGTPWLCMSYLTGTPAGEVLSELTPSQDAQLFEDIGIATKRLHEVRFEPARMPDNSIRPRNETEWQIVERYRRYRDAVLTRNDACRDVQSAASLAMEEAIATGSATAGRGEPCLVHGDLSTRNFLVSTSADVELSGVLDFERSTFGDPAQDLAMIWFKDLQGNQQREAAFLQGYSELSQDVRERVQFHALGMLFEIANWSWEMDRAYFDFAMETLRRRVTGERRPFSK
jgi:aminoglycoside phosphotransferase (APT) family kinase protein